MHPPLVLASGSNARRMLFETMGIPFTVDAAAIDEKAICDPNPVERAQRIAAAKGEVVAVRHPDALVMAADTFVVLDGAILEKPHDLEEARKMLRDQSDRWSEICTGYWYRDGRTGRVHSFTAVIRVKMRLLSASEIERYVTKYPVCTYAAAFSPSNIEGQSFMEEVKGSLMSCFYGFPLEQLRADLRESGVAL